MNDNQVPNPYSSDDQNPNPYLSNGTDGAGASWASSPASAPAPGWTSAAAPAPAPAPGWTPAAAPAPAPASNWPRMLGTLLLILALSGWVVDTALSGLSYLLSALPMSGGSQGLFSQGLLLPLVGIIGSLLFAAALAVVGFVCMAQARRSASGTAGTLSGIGDLALAAAFLVEGFSHILFLLFTLTGYGNMGFSTDTYIAVSSLVSWVDVAFLLAAAVLYIIAAAAGGQALRGKAFLAVAGALLALATLMQAFYSQLFDMLVTVLGYGAMTLFSILLSTFLGAFITAGVALRAACIIKQSKAG